ncbi:barstar family protein [Streptomyces melanogenes]|uniref:barstar family protein n=1 Tax=Streptomyces melanogenes TaxID=67326 RepID=UPI003797FE0A
MQLVLQGETIRTERDLHDTLAKSLDFGPYYGNNLDALWDRLTTDIEGPLEIIWRNSSASRQALGDFLFDQIAGLLIEVMQTEAASGETEPFVVRFE